MLHTDCFAQTASALGATTELTPIDVLPQVVKAGVVDEDIIDAIMVPMEVAHLHADTNLSKRWRQAALLERH